MSLYNTIYGVNKATYFILPMLGKHPEQYPRFRDSFAGILENTEETDQFGLPKKVIIAEEVISVYTRVGGGNREAYKEAIDELRKMPNYLRDYDDTFDSTFALFVFSVPQQWLEDYRKIVNNEAVSVSKEYVEQIKTVFPKLSEEMDNLFSPETKQK